MPPVATPLAPALHKGSCPITFAACWQWWVLLGGRLLAEPMALGRANTLSLSLS